MFCLEDNENDYLASYEVHSGPVSGIAVFQVNKILKKYISSLFTVK